MQYFEIENNDSNKKNAKKPFKILNTKLLIAFIPIFISVIVLLFIIVANYFVKQDPYIPKEEKKEEKKLPKIDNNKIEKNEINLEQIKKSPFLHTKYILDLFKEYNNLDFTIFEKNINKIKQRIYSIINNKKENEDLYKILSTIYGAFLADSMGSFCEFKPFNKNNHLSIFENNNERRIFKAGQVTDDSEMAMSQAYAIMDNSNYKSINEHLMFYYYVIWYYSNPLDIGLTTRKALNTLNLKDANINDNIIFSEDIKNLIIRQNQGSLANGLLMRISPLLSWFYMVNKNYIHNTLESKSTEKYYELYQKIYAEIKKDSQLTHPNRENAVAGAIFIFMGLCSMEQKYSGKDILNMTKILFEHNIFNSKEESILKSHFYNNLKAFEKNNFDKDIYFGNLSDRMGYYLHAYKLTLYYLYNFNEKTNLKNIYNEIMYEICDFGGDTDTNAAIVGMVMGPLIGLENFDKNYLETFLSFYSKDRMIYTNVFMYFYAKYLIDISNNTNISYNDSNVNFNFFKMINDMINKEL